jgi:acetyltransferase-like isoleucine patch superfamily enzyme
MSEAPVFVCAPREGVNDDNVRVIEWLVADGAQVSTGTALVVIETTKTAIEVEATAAGYAFHLVAAGTEIPVGTPVVAIAGRPERPHIELAPTAKPDARSDQIVTRKAAELIASHGLSLEDFADLEIVRSADVEARLQKTATSEAPAPTFRGEALKTDADWDGPCDVELHRELGELLGRLRRRMRAKYHRHVATNELLYDRWELAKDYDFGEGTSVYDSCLILGPVKVGRHCWVGPSTILDGQGGLTIGDYVDIGAGAHVYSHNTINRVLTGHRAPLFKKATTIGSCCFISPHSIIAPGTVIGDHSFVAAASYVEGVFPPNSYIAGNPAKRIGTIEVEGDRVRIRHDKPS